MKYLCFTGLPLKASRRHARCGRAHLPVSGLVLTMRVKYLQLQGDTGIKTRRGRKSRPSHTNTSHVLSRGHSLVLSVHRTPLPRWRFHIK